MNVLTNLFIAYLLHNQYGVPEHMTLNVLEAFECSPDLNLLNDTINNIRLGKVDSIEQSVIDNSFKCIEDLVEVSIESDNGLNNETKEMQKKENKSISYILKNRLIEFLTMNHVKII